MVAEVITFNRPMAREDTMKKKAEGKLEKKVNIMTEVETLRELIDREKASVTILLSAASGFDRLESDDVLMTMRDFSDRAEKMGSTLDRLEKSVRLVG
jgi:hypothetical protein